MKVVLNKCHGGFSLSAAAVKRLAELQGKECYFFVGYGENAKPVKGIPSKDSFLWSAYSVPFVPTPPKEWKEMSSEERIWHNEKCAELRLDSRPRDRSALLLVQVVEELGNAANGSCAELKIVEIPDGIEYVIEEYDGIEWVAEKHRTWG